MSRLLTVREAAELLKLGPRCLYEKIRSGALPAVTLGRTRRIRAEDLQDFIARNLSGRTPAA